MSAPEKLTDEERSALDSGMCQGGMKALRIIDAHAADRAALVAQLEAAERWVDVHMAQVVRAEDELSVAVRRLEELETALDAPEQQAIAARAAEAETQVAELTALLAERDAAVKEARDERDEALKLLATRVDASRLDEANGEVTRLTRERDEARAQVNRVYDSLDKRDAEVTRLTEALAAAERERDGARVIAGQADLYRDATEARVRELEANCNDWRNAHRTQQERAEAAEARVRELESLRERHEAAFANLRALSRGVAVSGKQLERALDEGGL